jgi:hypothetical protein
MAGSILRLITSEPVVVCSVGGKDLFDCGLFYHIDKIEGLADCASEMPLRHVNVYEVVKDATFEEIFFEEMFFDADIFPDRLALNQKEAVDFITNHKYLLRDGGFSNFFLLESRIAIFKLVVAGINFNRGVLFLYFYDFLSPRVWAGRSRYRVIVLNVN